MNTEIIETSADGKKLQKLEVFDLSGESSLIEIHSSKEFQTITGFGGSFTESSAHVLSQLSPEKRSEILEAYFGDSGAKYSLTRTHINSCDFSLSQYSYAPVPGDIHLENFSIDKDRELLIPLIKDAMTISSDGFKLISSPWTAPPWMKDNQDWVGGKLLKEHYPTWALFFAKYLAAYQAEGIPIWGVTVENEPHGNGNNWESMHYSPEEMTEFVQHHLGPTLENNGQAAIKIFGYDQNRAGLKDWVDVMFATGESSKYFAGTAIHWYESTYEVFPEALNYAHAIAPDKYLIQTEACVDAEVPKWKDDAWYWSKEATDWGWDWAPEDEKYLHPKYVPTYRYARDIIGCLNNWVDGWIDWNIVLDRQGGPNWFKNWCVAPVIVDPASDEVYYTPIYYTLVHFSKYIRPRAKVIGVEKEDDSLLVTAAKNPDKSIAVVILNQDMEKKVFELKLGEEKQLISISPQAIQTILIPSNN
ncbi:glycoside hydrolase family 30 beta sandwich domain-containing protein [Algoriphagus namhaensis]|uniref:Glycoside hydrolase family 30 beta sandwich domain-containing protein n=1 Tax=Algoriphagus namhaensis TaxID=915353 RepID=A0ABV8ATQ1_9BACT